jgi:hypothetical protein
MTQKRFIRSVTELAGEHLGIQAFQQNPLSSVYGVRVLGVDELVLLFWRFGIW